MFNGRRQPSCDGTSRMTRECQVRICERLGVKFPGPTRPKARLRMNKCGRGFDQAEHAVSHHPYPLYQPPLLEPEIHVHLAVHLHRCGKILAGLLWLAGAAIELAQA
jgi:hypothetical protein